MLVGKDLNYITSWDDYSYNGTMKKKDKLLFCKHSRCCLWKWPPRVSTSYTSLSFIATLASLYIIEFLAHCSICLLLFIKPGGAFLEGKLFFFFSRLFLSVFLYLSFPLSEYDICLPQSRESIFASVSFDSVCPCKGTQTFFLNSSNFPFKIKVQIDSILSRNEYF